MLPNPEVREVTIQDYIKIFQKRLGIIIAFLIIIPSATTIFVFTIKPLYRATTSILIERAGKLESEYSQFQQRDRQFYQTEYSILASRVLAERVFNELHLSKDPDFAELKDPIGALQSKIKIEPVKDSQIVLVNVEDTDALRASAAANAIANNYIQQDFEMRNRAAKQAVGWLETQLEDLKKKVQNAEEALNKYIQTNKIVTVPDIETKSEALLDSLKKAKSDLETQRADASRRYREKHPKMISLNAQLEDINKKIEQETTNILSLSQKMVQYHLLKKEAESIQQLYTSILTKSKEADISEKLKLSTVRIVDAAKPPSLPFKPQKEKYIMMSVLFSIFGGLGLSVFLEYLDSSLRTADDINSYLNLPFLGYIPTVNKEAKTPAEKNLICHQMPRSTVTESYRAIRTSILFASPEDKPLKKILVTSTIPQEGKSFTATNLSIVFAQLNERIILIDMDMRRPTLHHLFGVELKPGLSNFLITPNMAPEMIIKTTPVPNLSLITAGTIPPNPTELLSSGKINQLFGDLLSKFNRIVIDSPPILSVAESSLLANIVDGVVLVVKGGSTPLQGALRSKAKILEAKGKIIGVIVNNIEPEKEDRYYYYHYYYQKEGEKQK